ncbi:D-alanine--D-alanine ligase family protein [Streptomyces formicae]|uniref:ATP-grasp domain-containing protein n=1 Tax=Streptomyces formicae TaxID=1616117 RepID=A0ABY3WRI1_9ACTN|nr:ATP-grasp domain-containing protein [Streptomyces formicae]UNM14710.1 ATP-grasp domain-containing protein [Streptomyces formicae]
MSNTRDHSGLRIGVLFGGDSPERSGSVTSAEAACKALTVQGLNAQLIDLTGLDLTGLKGRIDVALLASHGLGGEDGKIQGALDTLGIPYTGSGVKASAVGMHKPTFKTAVRGAVIDTPQWLEIHPNHSTATTVTSVTMSLGFPVFLKPASGGGSLEAGIARNATELAALLERNREQPYTEYLVEEFIPGTPATVGVLEIGGELTTLPIHTVETDREFYDYEAKHDLSLRRETCPAVLPDLIATQMRSIALRVHRLVGAHGVSRVDFLVSPSGRTPVLEINTVPGLSEFGNLATMVRAADISYEELIVHVLDTAFTKSAYVP